MMQFSQYSWFSCKAIIVMAMMILAYTTVYDGIIPEG